MHEGTNLLFVMSFKPVATLNGTVMKNSFKRRRKKMQLVKINVPEDECEW